MQHKPTDHKKHKLVAPVSSKLFLTGRYSTILLSVIPKGSGHVESTMPGYSLTIYRRLGVLFPVSLPINQSTLFNK